MKEITLQQAREKNLKLVGNIKSFNLSQVVLMMKIWNDKYPIKYYSTEFAVDEETHNGRILVNFWNDK